jgi:hypothetical protein
LIPDALPSSRGATAFSTAVGTVGSAIETPTPAISRAMSSSAQFVDSEPLMAAQASTADSPGWLSHWGRSSAVPDDHPSSLGGESRRQDREAERR